MKRPQRFRARPLLCAVLLLGCGVEAHPIAPPIGGPSTGSSGGMTGTTTGAGGSTASGGTTGLGGSSATGGGSGGNAQTGAGGSASGGTFGTGGSATGAGGSGTGTGGSATGTGGSATGTGGSPVSGAGVTINGKFVPKEKAVVFIHFGHSNMRGQASKPASLMSYFYNTQDGLWTYRGSFALAKEETAPEPPNTTAGPGMAILHAAQDARQPGSDVQFISIGYGKGSATTVDYATTGTYYGAFMTWAKALKGNVTFGGIVVMLGLTDGEHLPSNQVPGFPMRMTQILTSIRADLDEPNLPVLFCDYEQNATGTLAPTGSVGVVMQPLIRMLPSMVSNLALVPTDGIEMQDDHHFDMQGHKDWGARVISVMKTNGWYKW
jgi:hypothetical protein